MITSDRRFRFRLQPPPPPPPPPASWSWSGDDGVWDAQSVRCGVGGVVVLYGVVLGGGWVVVVCIGGYKCGVGCVVLRVVVCLCCLFVLSFGCSGRRRPA